MKTNAMVLLIGLFAAFSACSDYSSLDESVEILSLDEDGFSTALTDNIKKTLTTDSVATEAEMQTLLYMREEEKMANNLYASFFANDNLQVFERISRSEATHAEAILLLITTFGGTDNSPAEAGKFTNAAIQALYDELLAKGTVSDTNALKIGAKVEEVDILDLQKAISETSNENILLVYNNLLRASRNHLRAFNRFLTEAGVTYVPEHLTAEEFTAIVTSPMEKGDRKMCNDGKGKKGENGKQKGGKGKKGKGRH